MAGGVVRAFAAIAGFPDLYALGGALFAGALCFLLGGLVMVWERERSVDADVGTDAGDGADPSWLPRVNSND